MSKSSIAKLVLGVLYLGFVGTYFIQYLDFSGSIDGNKPISYVYVDRKIKGGRSNYYEMTFSYNNQEQTISISRKEYDLISKQQYPDLYLSKSGAVFSKWEIRKSSRIAIGFFVLFVVAVTPWSFLLKRMGIIKSAQDVGMGGRNNRKYFL
ncbi:hypothetical protein KK062_11045 [Fulvivirgaceae bacterium PWU5]|uniref:DUF3592 domain-containing protein n=1 Tax=Dawidia cretensis TaxID=2782350 RepID=A0AAP2GUE1_9BACT|nr:hypothetical protein [Dawidia cretensis]MBT1708765.1 hypothetical protein [Dawidia cretensis]